MIEIKTAIVYASTHHGNTKKLVDAIAESNTVQVIDVMASLETDLNGYDLIGFASGVAYGQYYPQILRYMERKLPRGKKVFFLHTAGSPREDQNSAAQAIAKEKQCIALGTYFCKGYDTYGPFKLIGGIAKGHPDQREVAGAAAFFEAISKEKMP